MCPLATNDHFHLAQALVSLLLIHNSILYWGITFRPHVLISVDRSKEGYFSGTMSTQPVNLGHRQPNTSCRTSSFIELTKQPDTAGNYSWFHYVIVLYWCKMTQQPNNVSAVRRIVLLGTSTVVLQKLISLHLMWPTSANQSTAACKTGGEDSRGFG